MGRLYAEIHKRIGEFGLDILIDSDASRIGILGASGSGKSMTLRSISGIEDVDSGRIEVDGRVLFDSKTRTNIRPQKRNVGYMFQNYALFPTMTVMQNVMAGLRGRSEENRALEKNPNDTRSMMVRVYCIDFASWLSEATGTILIQSLSIPVRYMVAGVMTYTSIAITLSVLAVMNS